LWNCGSFTEKISEKVRNHRKRLDLYPAINIHPLIDLHPVIGENTLASHPSDGFLHFFDCSEGLTDLSHHRIICIIKIKSLD
jgi:hypothetical protein